LRKWVKLSRESEGEGETEVAMFDSKANVK
jgi:hypothetical protein